MRSDTTMALNGFYTKSRFLSDLLEKIHEHRRDDLNQLAASRQETGVRWDERLGRLAQWTASAETLHPASLRLVAWRETAQWFNRAETVSRRFVTLFPRKLERLETRLSRVGDRVRHWSARLSLKEIELREFIDRQLDPSGIPVPASRKEAYLDFAFLEREEEGQISSELKNLSAGVRRALGRLGRPEAWLEQKALIHPAYFEIRKNQILEAWRPLQNRVDAVSEEALHLGLAFEEGRKCLRGIYEMIQRLRAIPDAPVSDRRPFFLRLFNIQDD
jgi:hypothetical protein